MLLPLVKNRTKINKIYVKTNNKKQVIVKFFTYEKIYRKSVSI